MNWLNKMLFGTAMLLCAGCVEIIAIPFGGAAFYCWGNTECYWTHPDDTQLGIVVARRGQTPIIKATAQRFGGPGTVFTVSPITGITTLGNILDCLPEEEGLVANTDALDAGEANVFLSRIQFERFESIADSGRFYESVTGVRGRFSDLHVDSIERDALQSAIEDHFIDFSVECYALVAGNVFIATSVMEANSIQYAFVVDRGYFLKTLPGDYPDVSDYAIFGAEVMTEKSENSPWISVAHSRVIAVDFQSVLELRTDNTSSPNLAEMVSRYERLHP